MANITIPTWLRWTLSFVAIFVGGMTLFWGKAEPRLIGQCVEYADAVCTVRTGDNAGMPEWLYFLINDALTSIAGSILSLGGSAALLLGSIMGNKKSPNETSSDLVVSQH